MLIELPKCGGGKVIVNTNFVTEASAGTWRKGQAGEAKCTWVTVWKGDRSNSIAVALVYDEAARRLLAHKREEKGGEVLDDEEEPF